MSLERYGGRPRKSLIWTGARGHSQETKKARRRYRRISKGEGTISPATIGLRQTGRSNSNDDSGSASNVRNTSTQRTILVLPPGTSYAWVSSSHRCTMQARRQPRRQGSLDWSLERMYGERAQDERPASCIGTVRLRDLQCKSCRRIGRVYGEVGHQLGHQLGVI